MLSCVLSWSWSFPSISPLNNSTYHPASDLWHAELAQSDASIRQWCVKAVRSEKIWVWGIVGKRGDMQGKVLQYWRKYECLHYPQDKKYVRFGQNHASNKKWCGGLSPHTLVLNTMPPPFYSQNHLSNPLHYSPVHLWVLWIALRFYFNQTFNSQSSIKITISYGFCLSFHNIFFHIHRHTNKSMCTEIHTCRAVQQKN